MDSPLNKLADFSEDDVKALNELLDKWTVRDALVVLDEIDQRIAIIEAIKKLSKDDNIDELHTLHPLATQARWLFGPEFDTPEYTSNISLRNNSTKPYLNRHVCITYAFSSSSLSIGGESTMTVSTELSPLRFLYHFP